jgi:superfamily I DNA/RNA helicase
VPQVAISDDFLTALARVPKAQQKKVRDFISRFRVDPTAASINYESLRESRDSRVRTVRIDLSYRAVVLHPTKGNIHVLLWVDNHDEAMAWVRNKRFDVNPVTGALQVLDTEMVAEAAEAVMGVRSVQSADDKPLSDYALFETFSDKELLRTGLPKPLLPAVRALQSPEELDALQRYLPAEAYESLFWIANLGYSVDQAIAEVSTTTPAAVDTEDIETALARPDSRRRFVIVESDDELAEMLNAPLEKWRIFLHPSQARLVKRHFNGPARVLGGAGTGKTVVAMHRARHLARDIYTDKNSQILFTTFTRNLAMNISQNLDNLCGPERDRIEVVHLHKWASQFLRGQGIRMEIATNSEIDRCWQDAVGTQDTLGHPVSFYRQEYEQIVQAQTMDSRNAYLRASRRGRGVSLNRLQRSAVWDVIEEYRRNLGNLGKFEWLDMIQQTRLYLAEKGNILPYRAIVVDESQDLHPEELRLLRQIVPEGANDLFFVGDAHQRIYGHPVVMSTCGINIRGRSSKLRINYRTTEEIRYWSVGILATQLIDDFDGGVDTHREYLSLMHGVKPVIHFYASLSEEQDALVKALRLLMDETTGDQICIVARTHNQLMYEYIPALQQAGLPYLYLQADTPEYVGSGIRLATMHRVKGLEFGHVYLVGVNEGTVPLYQHESELAPLEREEIELRERCLLHVASTRARESLTVSAHGRPSPFLGDSSS